MTPDKIIIGLGAFVLGAAFTLALVACARQVRAWRRRRT